MPAHPISALLDQARAARGLSDAACAINFGVSQSTFHRWRNGITTPEDSQVKALARWLLVDPAVVREAISKQREVTTRSHSRRAADHDLPGRVQKLEAEIASYRAALKQLTKEADAQRRRDEQLRQQVAETTRAVRRVLEDRT